MAKGKKRHRFHAFLRLYGPKGRATHALLVIPDSYLPEDDTPEKFHRELAEERRRDAMLNPLQRMQRLYVAQG